MPGDRDLLIGALCAATAAALFAMLGPLSRFAAEAGVPGVAFTAWRAGIGAVALGSLILVRGRGTASLAAIRGLGPRGRGLLALASVLGVVLNAAMFTAFGLIPIALALMLFYTYPAGVAVVDVLLGRERVTPARVAALLLSSLGVVLVLAGGIETGGVVAPDLAGVVLGLAAAAAQVVFVTVSRHGYRSVPADAATLLILLVSAIGSATLTAFVGQANGLLAPARSSAPWGILLLSGVAAACVASVLFLTAIRRIGGTRTGILMLLEPVVAIVLARIFLGEALAPVQGVGAALVLAGAIVLQVGAEPELEPVVEAGASPLV